MLRLRLGVARVSLVAAVLVAAVLASWDQLEAIARVPARAHLDGWSASENSRLRFGLQGWYPTFEGARANVPESAVLAGWVTGEDLPPGVGELFDLLRTTLAPRYCVPMRRVTDFPGPHVKLLQSRFPIYLIECHPEFGPAGVSSRPKTTIDPSIGELILVAEEPDFTLHEFRPTR